MSDCSQFFGEKGVFAEACDLYRNKEGNVPLPIRQQAYDLGDPQYIGYMMGYLFHKVLEIRKMDITDECLQYIGKSKFPIGGPEPFTNGFKSYKEYLSK